MREHEGTGAVSGRRVDQHDEQAEHDEDEQRERYRELLEELRTIIPGVQVLFAFLLTVPFSSRFQDLDDLGRHMWVASLVLVASAAITFLTPAAYHRIAHRRDRAARIRLGSRTTVAGMAMLASAIGCATFVVTRFVLDSTASGVLIGGGAGLMALLLWFTVPWLRRTGIASR